MRCLYIPTLSCANAVRLKEYAEIARRCWEDIPAHFPLVELDAFVIMPNHVHGIILVGAQFIAPDPKDGLTRHAPGLGEIVRAYKASVTRLVRRGDDGMTALGLADTDVMNHAPTGFAMAILLLVPVAKRFPPVSNGFRED